MEHWSVEDYKEFTNATKRKSKYRANKVAVDVILLIVKKKQIITVN